MWGHPACDCLSPGVLKIDVSNLEFDGDRNVLTAAGDGKRMVNKQYQLTVSYRGRDDIKQTRTFEPDFAGALQPFLLTGDRIALQADAGAAGEAGSHGDYGRSGQASAAKYGQGGPGGQGGAGRPGAPAGRV